jgi:hypothetical protein
VSEFLTKSQGGFSYIHLDFCSQYNQEESDAVLATWGRVAPVARIRVSALQTRRMEAQIEYENMLRRRFLLLLAEAARVVNKDEKWDYYIDALRESKDTTQIIAAQLLLQFFFNVNCWAWSDSCEMNTLHLPNVHGSHQLANIARFSHSEVGGRHIMATVWVDLLPLNVSTIPNEEWVFKTLDRFFLSIVNPIPNFVPELFREDS